MSTTLDAAATAWASDLFASGQSQSSASYWIEEDIAGMESIEEAIGRQMTGDDRANADAVIRCALAALENESV